jgi:tRNA threonylcarbamoyladenosine biosynthesis protein TsaE
VEGYVAGFDVLSDSASGTGIIAASLARHLHAGDVVLLSGGLAAGKTTAVQSMAAALGSSDAVTSPTFALVNVYAASPAPILHADAYRLSGVHEFRDLGLDEYIAESVTLIEWGEIVADDFPCHLVVHLERPAGHGADCRRISVKSACDEWLSRMPRIRADLTRAAAEPIGGLAR